MLVDQRLTKNNFDSFNCKRILEDSQHLASGDHPWSDVSMVRPWEKGRNRRCGQTTRKVSTAVYNSGCNHQSVPAYRMVILAYMAAIYPLIFPPISASQSAKRKPL